MALTPFDGKRSAKTPVSYRLEPFDIFRMNPPFGKDWTIGAIDGVPQTKRRIAELFDGRS